MDITALTPAIAAAIGGIITHFGKHVIDWAKGRTAREQSVWEQRDEQARRRRIGEEYILELRLLLINHGIEPPPYPEYRSKN